MFRHRISALTIASALLATPISAQDYGLVLQGSANFIPFAPGVLRSLGLPDPMPFIVQMDFRRGFRSVPDPGSQDTIADHYPERSEVTLRGAEYDASGTAAVSLRLIDKSRVGGGDYLQVVIEPASLPGNPFPDVHQIIFTRDLDPDALDGTKLPGDPGAFFEINALAVQPNTVSVDPAASSPVWTYDIFNLVFEVD